MIEQIASILVFIRPHMGVIHRAGFSPFLPPGVQELEFGLQTPFFFSLRTKSGHQHTCQQRGFGSSDISICHSALGPRGFYILFCRVAYRVEVSKAACKTAKNRRCWQFLLQTAFVAAP